MNEGYLLSFGAYINRWKTNKIKSNSACTANEPYIGEAVVTATSPDIGNGYGHRMTLVGYNDNIWVDINNNNAIDSGEMGAFKVANSYGTWWKNDGFIWFAYDNINMTTSVSGGLPYKTMSGLVDVTKITVLPYNSDADMYIRYTLNTSDRHNTVVTINAEKNGKALSVVAGPHHESPYLKNHYSFDGTTNSNDGTMIFMLSNVVPGITSETINDYKWSITFEDTKADSVALTVKNAEIVDNSTNRTAKASGTFGYKLDGSTRTMDFQNTGPYVAPTTATITTTTAPVVTTEPVTTVAVTTKPVVTDPAETTVTENITTETASEVLTTTEAQTTPVTPTTPATIYTDPTEITTEPVIIITTPTTTSVPIATTTAATTATEIETTTPVPATTTSPSIVPEYIYGDSNNSNNVSISDATLIQKHAAHMIDDDKINLTSADCNNDGKVSVKDATCIQKYLAKLDGYALAGEKYTPDTPATNTTEATEETIKTVTSTEVYTTTLPLETIITDPTETTTVIGTIEITDPVEITSKPVYTTEADITTLPQITTSAVTTTDPCETTTVFTTTVIKTEPTTTEPTTATPTTVEPTTVEPTTTEVVKINEVTFTNSYGWQGTISCYYWSDSNSTMTSWPGVPMKNAGANSFGEALYTLQIPHDATYIIFTNGSIQTVDIPYSGGEQKFYPVSQNGDGKYTVNTWV